MIDWHSKIDTIKAESFLPRLLVASGETVDSTAYYWDNSKRSDKPHILFKYTLAGCGMIEVGAQMYKVEAGQCFLMCIPGKNTKYYYPPDSPVPWSFVYCCFHGGRVEALYSRITAKYGHLFPLSRTGQIIERIMGLRYLENKTINAADGADIVFSLFTALQRSKNAEELTSSGNQLISQAKQIIVDNLDGQINVSYVADALGVSREHISRVFQAYLGITPHNYIEKERIYAACRLLRDSTLSIKQVGDRCGFGSPSQFGRVFKRLTKETPGNYRYKTIVPGIHDFI